LHFTTFFIHLVGASVTGVYHLHEGGGRREFQRRSHKGMLPGPFLHRCTTALLPPHRGTGELFAAIFAPFFDRQTLPLAMEILPLSDFRIKYSCSN